MFPPDDEERLPERAGLDRVAPELRGVREGLEIRLPLLFGGATRLVDPELRVGARRTVAVRLPFLAVVGFETVARLADEEGDEVRYFFLDVTLREETAFWVERVRAERRTAEVVPDCPSFRWVLFFFHVPSR